MRKNIVIAQRLYYSKHGRVFVQNGNLAVSEKEIFVLIRTAGKRKDKSVSAFEGLSETGKRDAGFIWKSDAFF